MLYITLPCQLLEYLVYEVAAGQLGRVTIKKPWIEDNLCPLPPPPPMFIQLKKDFLINFDVEFQTVMTLNSFMVFSF